MKVSFAVFFLFLHYVTISRSKEVLLEQIPDQWKKYPITKPINNHKNIGILNNKKLVMPLDTSLPTNNASLVKKHIVKPVINIPIDSPKLHNYTKPIKKFPPKSKQEPLKTLKLQDKPKEDEKKNDAVHEDTTLKLEIMANTLHNIIPKTLEIPNSVLHANNSKPKKKKNDLKVVHYHKKSRGTEIEKKKPSMKFENLRTAVNKTIPRNSEELKPIKTFENNSSKNDSGYDVDNTRSFNYDTEQKPNVEINLSDDTSFGTDDPDADVIIHNEEYQQFVSGPYNTVQDFTYQNEQDPNTCNVHEVFPSDYGRFTTNQYTNSLSDLENYANEYQMGTDTKQDNRYPFYEFTQYGASSVPQVIHSNERFVAVRDYSNTNNMWRSLTNTNVIIRNNPRNIQLFLNYGTSSGNKNFNQRSFINSHSDNTNLNFKPYYPRYVYN